jgi:hypothetical protein
MKAVENFGYKGDKRQNSEIILYRSFIKDIIIFTQK